MLKIFQRTQKTLEALVKKHYATMLSKYTHTQQIQTTYDT